MDHFQNIYANHAEEYDRLVSVEDYQGNLLPAINKVTPLAGKQVVEMGAGTGRVTRLLAPHIKSIHAFDGSEAMIKVAGQSLQAMGVSNWKADVADNRSIPLDDDSADIAIEGWSFAHSVAWHPDSWRDEIGAMMSEMERIVRPGGTMILLETLGTGYESPHLPNDGLATLYAWWHWEKGLNSTWVRTDLKYENVEHAAQSLSFFFGDEFGERVRREQLTIIPECTGLWWRTV